MLQNIKKTIYIIITLLICNKALAQVGDTIEVQRTKEGKIRFARFVPNSARSIQNSVSFLKQNLSTNAYEDFIETSTVVDSFGNTHKKFQQYYKGIKVDGGVYATHGKNGIVETMNGNYSPVNIGSVTPGINEATAISKAISHIKATTYKWQNAGMESLIKTEKGNSNATYYPKGELVVIKDRKSNSFKLAWKLVISCLYPDDEIQIYIDAQHGNKIASRSLIEHNNFYPARSNTQYSGVQNVTVDQTTSTNFRLRELRPTTNGNTVNMSTLNLQHGTNLSTAVDFTNTTSTFDASHWSSFNQDRSALDVHWGTEKVLDFWSTVFKRNSLNGSGLPIRNYLHYGSNFSNAGWDPVSQIMVYGDGDGNTFNGFASLDVMAHELGHGICHFTSNLGTQDQDQEEDALNEGLSDIWAACVKNWVNVNFGLNKSIWLIGNEILVPSSGFNFLRNMQNPKSPGGQQGLEPDLYHGTWWDFGGESHNNSTVLSHWFYLLSQGANEKNELNNAYNITGIGIANAAKIVYQAETNHYLISGATYSDARNAMISAVRDINNGVIGTCQEVAVTNAWYAVGVGKRYNRNSTTMPTLSGPSVICNNSSASFTLNDLPDGANIAWVPSNSLISVTPSLNGMSAVVTSHTSGVVNLVVNVNNVNSVKNCNIPTPQISKIINIGAPTVGGSYTNMYNNSTNNLGYYPINNSACTGYLINTNMTITGATSTKWSLVSSPSSNFSPPYLGGNDVSFYLSGSGQSAVFKLDAKNGCGTVTNQFKWLASNCGTGGGGCNHYLVSPNPTPNNLNVTVNVTAPCSVSQARESNVSNATTSDSLLIQEIRLYDHNGTHRKTITAGGARHSGVNLAGLSAGTYIIEITSIRNYKERQIFIKQ